MSVAITSSLNANRRDQERSVDNPETRKKSSPTPGRSERPRIGAERLLLLTQQVGNRALTRLLARGATVPLQRRVDLYAPVRPFHWVRPTVMNATPAKIGIWLSNADSDLNDAKNRAAVLNDPARLKGAEYLTSLDGTVLTKSYTYDETASQPDAMVKDLWRWSMLATAPDHFQSFLSKVWTDARSFPLGKAREDAIYDLYGGQRAGHPVLETATDSEYFGRLKPWLENKFAGWEVFAQGGYFMHVDSPAWKSLPESQKATSRRFYLHPGPDYMTAVNTFVDHLAGVVAGYGGKAKVVSPGQYGARNDAVVIWIPAANAKAAKADLRSTAPSVSSALPPMLKTIAPGLATGREPEHASGTHSFGSLRAEILSRSIEGARDFEAFLIAARVNFLVAGIPWDAPHKGG